MRCLRDRRRADRRANVFHVLADATVQGLSPEGLGRPGRGGGGAVEHAPVVAEANNGGAMVESVLECGGRGLKVRLVHAPQGQGGAGRAGGAAVRERAGRCWRGDFRALEDELAGIIAGGGYEGPGRSPDRADAMVWALTALSESRSGRAAGAGVVRGHGTGNDVRHE